MYVIWSFEHNAWWNPNRAGYTTDLEKAGKYDSVDAGDIVTSSVFLEEIAVLYVIAKRNGAPKYHPYNGANDE